MIPVGWTTVPVADVAAALFDGPFGSALKTSDYTTSGIRVARLENIGHLHFREELRSFVSIEKAQSLARHMVQSRDILFSSFVDRETRVCLVPEFLGGKMINKADCFCIRVDRQLCDPFYLAYQLAAPKAYETFCDSVRGITRPRIGLRDLGAFEILLPPLAEQRGIVAKLDALTARLARARTELEQVVSLTDRIRAVALREAVNAFRDRTRASIDTLCRVGTGATPRRGETRYYAHGTIPWVASGAVNHGTITLPTELITEAAIRETNCRVYPAGSLVLALYGEGKTRGKVATLGISAATNQALAVIHSIDLERVSPQWIRIFLEARYEETRRSAAGGVQPNLSLGIVKAIEIPLPNLEEQFATISTVRTIFARADRLKAEATRAKSLLDRLESALLAKAFRGELTPQDPNDEPASALLDRIRATRTAQPKPKRGRTPQAPSATRAPREKAAMTKSRSDHAVKNKPYLAGLLRAAGGKANAETLFKEAELSIADFYKQLAWEVDAGHIKDNAQVLEAT